jgi:hypothetical protein
MRFESDGINASSISHFSFRCCFDAAALVDDKQREMVMRVADDAALSASSSDDSFDVDGERSINEVPTILRLRHLSSTPHASRSD